MFRFAPPWRTTLKRRKETTSLLIFVMLLPLSLVAWYWAVVFLLFPLTTLPMMAYLYWAHYIDKSGETGSRTPFLRKLPISQHFADYFPVRMHVEPDCKLPAGKPHILAYHPHGIIGLGALASNATLLPQNFPHLDVRLLTLDTNLKIPWIREFYLWSGICSASRRSISNLLGKGSSVMLVVGGAAEALSTRPGTNRLTLANRHGFVRLAVEHGADLVPVFSFGENNAYSVVSTDSDGWARRTQNYLQKKMGFSMPIFYGRGIFNYSFGFLPHRRPMDVVVGAPIKVTQAPEHLRGRALTDTEEGKELVMKYHRLYVEALAKLYDKHKGRFDMRRRESMQIS